MATYRNFIPGIINLLTGKRDGAGYSDFTDGAAHVTRGYVNSTQSNAAVTALEEIAEISVSGKSTLTVEVGNVGAVLTEFAILGRVHASASYQTLFSTAAEFLSPVGDLLGASGDLTIIGDGSTGWFKLDVKGWESVQVKAACASTTATTTYWGAE